MRCIPIDLMCRPRPSMHATIKLATSDAPMGGGTIFLFLGIHDASRLAHMGAAHFKRMWLLQPKARQGIGGDIVVPGLQYHLHGETAEFKQHGGVTSTRQVSRSSQSRLWPR